MAGRKPDTNLKYKVVIHKQGKYRYAATQEYIKNKKGKYIHKYHIWGTVDKNLVFSPNEKFRLISVTERNKMRFPSDWNIEKIYSSQSQLQTSKIEKVKTQTETSNPPPLSSDQYNNKLYGSIWLMEQLAKKLGIIDDLLEVFDNDIIKVNEIIALAIFPYLSQRNYNRMAIWQHTHKTQVNYDLNPSYITKLTQKITDEHRMSFIERRIKRHPALSYAACDSTTRSAWGKCLADIKQGYNKDNKKLQNTIEVVVYSLELHEPVYYRSFPGNMIDMSTIRTIISDLKALGVTDITLITDRGYTSIENMARFVTANIPFITGAKINQKPVISKLLEIEYDENGVPLDLTFDEKENICYTQVELDEFDADMGGMSITVKGLKVNFFLDIPKRARDLVILTNKIKEEKKELTKIIKQMEGKKLTKLIKQKKEKEEIQRINALFEYYTLYISKNEIGYKEKKEKIKKEKAKCGYFASIMYNVNITAKEALTTYRLREEQEHYFYQMKDQMGFHTQQNSSEAGKVGRLLILFIGLILSSKIKYVWKNSKMNNIYDTSLTMIDELEAIRYTEYSNGTSHITTFTAKQVNICLSFGIIPPLECVPASMRNNIQSLNEQLALI